MRSQVCLTCSGPSANDLTCGRPTIAPTVSVTERIIGGVEARAHSWPWQCNIRYKYLSPPWGQWCGASALSDRYVLTAAHCMFVTLFVINSNFTIN